MLAIFNRLVANLDDEDAMLEVLEELMTLRASYAIAHACDGFGMTVPEALELIRSEAELDFTDENKRESLLAAFDNLIDFAVAEEYQMVRDALGIEDDEEAEKIFSKYNRQYVVAENKDIEYAMIVAASLASVKSHTILTYWTQGDERVRPWHRTYEGYSATKEHFPGWLVPPIEHGCRCFLVEDVTDMGVMAASGKEPEMPEWFNPTFKESVAFGGRIFSDEHPYFQIDKEHIKVLTQISDRIKSQYFNGKTD